MLNGALVGPQACRAPPTSCDTPPVPRDDHQVMPLPQTTQTKIRRGGHTEKGSLSRPEAVGAAVGRLVLPPYTVPTQHISRGQAVPSPTGSDVRWPWVVPISVWAPATGLPSGNSFLNACREPKIVS